MLSSISLSASSIDLLQQRGLSDQQVQAFGTLLNKAAEQLNGEQSARQVLSNMSPDEINLVQKATGLVDPIRPSTLSDEGAINLLAQPDKTGMVDLNNDGIVEVGIGKMITFPPVNAPASVHQAWEKATAQLSEGDKMTMQLHMHSATYGIRIDGVATKQALPPEEQWSSAGWQKLLESVRAGLDFAVSMDGWTRTNLLRQDFFNKFENELTQRIG
ncbi:hypothetical protein [Motiliproteus sediminis]|uniref:hypothetical protein n=1 Tax=Motiliproteus sediminis TaxID=1468178 RepID=UPI001AEF914C|nr:hypothetical protein [Motiliproteus sediminis]